MRYVINYFDLYSNFIVFFIFDSEKNKNFNVFIFSSGIIVILSGLFKSKSCGGFLKNIFSFFAYFAIF